MSGSPIHDRPTPRWRVTVVYRTDTGPLDVTHYIEELDELHNLIELGPNWNTIEQITVVLARVGVPGLTVEAATNE